jgi:hypothetical protein
MSAAGSWPPSAAGNTGADGSGALDQYLVSTLNLSGGQVDRIETFLSAPSRIAAYFGS